MPWHSAVALAHCSRIGVKIALPEGGWTSGELAADVWVRSDGTEFGKGLKLRLTSLPECSRRWAAGFQSVFNLPLSQDVTRQDDGATSRPGYWAGL